MKCYLIDGTLVSGSAITLERARRTLLNGYDLPDVISVESDTVGLSEVTSMDFFFDNMSNFSGQDVRIILESSVVPDEPFSPGVPPIYGKHYVWDPDVPDWIELSCPDHADASSVPAGSFGYYTPDYTGRRIFDFKDCRLREIGQTSNQFTIRVVHYSEYPFKSQHDLVQVLWAGSYGDCNCNVECEEEEGPIDPMRGADMDYNSVIDLTDALAFDAAYLEELPCADLNRDGVVDETDQTLFAERFGD